tara:strand:- start:610 stop:801 length:192 start_codon:yes stop_codon:yes gene_type:complete
MSVNKRVVEEIGIDLIERWIVHYLIDDLPEKRIAHPAVDFILLFAYAAKRAMGIAAALRLNIN